MIFAAVALLLLGVLIGGAGMRAHLRNAGALWRPGAGLIALVAFVAAAALLVREAWLPALIVAAAGAALAVGARRRSPPAPRRAGSMSVADARSILGVEAGASPEQIREAYRRLMKAAHPDRGGTRGLASQLNAARDALLGKG